MNTTIIIVLASIALTIVLYIFKRQASHRQDTANPLPTRNPNLQAFQLAPGVVYAAETAEQACSLANDQCFEEYDPANARQLREDELSTVVRQVGEPTDPDATTTLRAELQWRRSVGWPGMLSMDEVE